MENEFKELYNFIICSNDEDKMHVLGDITKEMMHNVIQSNPQQAREYLDKLSSVKWCNFLTSKEADEIVSKMTPAPNMNRTSWLNAMSSLDYIKSEMPYYNDNALYVTMCMIMSDSGKTIQNCFDQIAANMDNLTVFKFIHKLALDKLKDEDGVFNIRSYFKI